MPVVRERPRRTRGAMISIPPMPIIIGTEDRLQAMILNKPVMWVKKNFFLRGGHEPAPPDPGGGGLTHPGAARAARAAQAARAA